MSKHLHMQHGDSGAVEEVALAHPEQATTGISALRMRLFGFAKFECKGFSTAPQSPI
jgi:hypothetical protein